MPGVTFQIHFSSESRSPLQNHEDDSERFAQKAGKNSIRSIIHLPSRSHSTANTSKVPPVSKLKSRISRFFKCFSILSPSRLLYRHRSNRNIYEKIFIFNLLQGKLLIANETAREIMKIDTASVNLSSSSSLPRSHAFPHSFQNAH